MTYKDKGSYESSPPCIIIANVIYCIHDLLISIYTAYLICNDMIYSIPGGEDVYDALSL